MVGNTDVLEADFRTAWSRDVKSHLPVRVSAVHPCPVQTSSIQETRHQIAAHHHAELIRRVDFRRQLGGFVHGSWRTKTASMSVADSGAGNGHATPLYQKIRPSGWYFVFAAGGRHG